MNIISKYVHLNDSIASNQSPLAPCLSSATLSLSTLIQLHIVPRVPFHLYCARFALLLFSVHATPSSRAHIPNLTVYQKPEILITKSSAETVKLILFFFFLSVVPPLNGNVQSCSGTQSDWSIELTLCSTLTRILHWAYSIERHFCHKQSNIIKLRFYNVRMRLASKCCFFPAFFRLPCCLISFGVANWTSGDGCCMNRITNIFHTAITSHPCASRHQKRNAIKAHCCGILNFWRVIRLRTNKTGSVALIYS